MTNMPKFEQIVLKLRKAGLGEICPSCGHNGYGLLQDKYCTDCAYVGEDRNADEDRIKFLGSEEA